MVLSIAGLSLQWACFHPLHQLGAIGGYYAGLEARERRCRTQEVD